VLQSNHEYSAEVLEEAHHLCSIICNINALLLMEEHPMDITIANLRLGAELFPKEDEVFRRTLVAKPHALVLYESVRSTPEDTSSNTLLARLFPAGTVALDAWARFPGHGALLRQTKGQHLGAAGAHKRRSGLGRLLKLMQIARPDQPQDKSAHNKPRILAYEIAPLERHVSASASMASSSPA